MILDELISAMKILILLFVSSLFISSCNKTEQDLVTRVPTAITAGDECHLCGMIVSSFAGPKGQAFVRHHDPALKFCSTVDLISWLLQPDTPAILQVAFVHDMGAAPSWETPTDTAYVKTTEAWYVAGHQLAGAMGHTLASFRSKQDASLFIKKHGGRLLRYADINLALLANLNQPSH